MNPASHSAARMLSAQHMRGAAWRWTITGDSAALGALRLEGSPPLGARPRGGCGGAALLPTPPPPAAAVPPVPRFLFPVTAEEGCPALRPPAAAASALHRSGMLTRFRASATGAPSVNLQLYQEPLNVAVYQEPKSMR